MQYLLWQDSPNKGTQDRIWTLPDGDRILVVIADGAGGLAGGGAAADAAIRTVQDNARNAFSSVWCARLVSAADEIAHRHSQAGLTTMTIVNITPRVCWGAAVGNSHLARLGEDGLDLVTGGSLMRPMVGSGRVEPFRFDAELVPGERLVLATDGLWSYASHPTVEEAILESTLTGCLTGLERAIRLPSGGLQDDVAMALVETGARAPVEMPADSLSPVDEDVQQDRQDGPPPNPLRILMVEDHEPFALTAISVMLACHDVTWVRSAAEVREVAAADFDVALIDYDLPDCKGVSVTRALLKEWRRMPIVAISAREDGNAALMEAGADVVCSKMEFQRIEEVLSGLIHSDP